jgi:hypothetical protein
VIPRDEDNVNAAVDLNVPPFNVIVAALPKWASAPTETLPAKIVVPPEYEFDALDNVSVPAPDFVNTPVPDTTPDNVAEEATSIVAVPDKTIGSAIGEAPNFNVELVTVVEAALAPSALVFATSSVPEFTAVVPL